jgi:cytoskeletal protein CcmA (bactofilin family)
MFNRSQKTAKTLHIDTLVGAGTRVIGDLQFKGGLHVDGAIHGNVESVEGVPTTLSISDGGLVEGSVKVSNLVLNGTVNGDIHATDRVELGATAKVAGNVYYGLIEMAMGAQITGKLIPNSPATAGQSAANPSVIGVAATELGYTGATA